MGKEEVRTLLCGVCVIVVSVASVVSAVDSDTADNNVVNEGNQILNEFYHRYNTTKEVDLVFVLDRSGSVPLEGWRSMLNFIKKVLEHFTVDKDNTRVAVVTYGTTARVDINDLDLSDGNYTENKCTFFSRLTDRIEPQKPQGYTATYDALNKTFNILLNSRPNAKKAVLVLTDGKSNIGPPPVKIAVDILALHWDIQWDHDTLGPQIEIYAFGIENAYFPELRSVASHLANHAYRIPKFSQFEALARSLHGGLQEDNWVVTDHNDCAKTCNSTFALCMCGSKIGVTQCVCEPGYEMSEGQCTACPPGYYKGNFRPESCRPCPENTTTHAVASRSQEDCYYLPGHMRCPSLPKIKNGQTFQVTGRLRDEVFNTGVSCDDVRDGDSCHYECDVGFRLSGPPVMICNHTGMWEGTIPECNAINCHSLESVFGDIEGGDLTYLHNHTLYGSKVTVTCHTDRVPMPRVTSWSCDQHGRWTIPANFKCEKVFCPPLDLPPFMSVSPRACADLTAHSTTCNLTCDGGFELQGGHSRKCGYLDRSVWLPQQTPKCQDIEKPVITCPNDVQVTVAHMNDQSTQVHYAWEPRTLSDNSRDVNFTVHGVPPDEIFPVGHTELQYTATDGAGLTASCSQDIHVLGKQVENTFCPDDMSLVGSSQNVTFPPPVFVGPDQVVLSHVCHPATGTVFTRGTTRVMCYHEGHPAVKCAFNVSIEAKTCPEPPEMKAPPHGTLVCGINFHFQYVCRVMCEVGYSIRGKDAQEFRCRADGKWTPDFERVPKCHRTFLGRKLVLGESIHIRYPGACEDNKQDIRQAFKVTMAAVLTDEFGPCEAPHTCQVQDVSVLCGTTRRKRTSQTRLVRRSTRDAEINFAFWISREADSFNDTYPDMMKADQNAMRGTLLTVVNNVTNTVFDGNFSLDVHGVQAVGVDAVVDEKAVLPLNCTDNQHVFINDDDIETIEGYCMTCAAGTFLKSGSCQPCALSTYQAEEGQDHCDICPGNTSTLTQAAWDINQCKERCRPETDSDSGFEPCTPVCPAGHYSDTGIEPCLPCPTGLYQSYSHQTYCSSCPENTTTASEGTDSRDHCGVLCDQNTFSKTGVEPCEQCPPGTYQPLRGQTSDCRLCHYAALDAEMAELCPDPVDCSDYHTSCVNGFCVVSQTNRTQCICRDGFHGDACELDIDECKKARCLNGGTCHDVINGYICNCTSGYSGTHCERYIGPCTSQPCLNNGSCVDKNQTYQCVCSPGFNGTRCEMGLDPCEPNPCTHGLCTAIDNQFSCSCEPGYAGSNCDKAIDYCSNFTCLQGGTCFINGSDAACTCPSGYTGQICNKRVDHCSPEPCQNNGRCVNAISSHHCVCQNGYYGDTCLQAAEPQFDLLFPGDTASYAELPVWDSLTELTACLWLRSSEKYNFGTLFSYAAVSNWLSTSFTDVLTLYDLNNLAVVVNGDRLSTKLRLNDGHWHHVCVTWQGQSGLTEVYINGTVRITDELAKHTSLEAGGMLVVGQRQIGRFDRYFAPSGAYKGEISQLTLYSSVLGAEQIQDLANHTFCHPGSGDIISWSSVLAGLHRMTKVQQSLCLDENECMEPGVCGEEEMCVDVHDGYKCEVCSPVCPGQPIMDYCSSSPCHNGGSCVTTGTGFRCECAVGLTGPTCDLLTSSCTAVTCHNHGQCREVAGGVRCICDSAWRGRYCEVWYEPTCLEEPCLNGGTCLDEKLSYKCVCPKDGRNYGANCEIQTDCQIEPFPCIDGATCVVMGTGNVTCICPFGYPGDDCRYVPTTTIKTTTIPTDFCLNVHCKNGGTCVNAEGGFNCQCNKDYTGLYCNKQRPTETRRYDITVNIKKKYYPGLKENEAFKDEFKRQVHQVYSKNIKPNEGKLLVRIEDIRPGSVEVDFFLDHTVYLDGVAPGPEAMRNVIYGELQNNKLGDYPASLHNFKFNYKDGVDTSLHWAIYLVVAIAIFIVSLAVVIGVYIVLRRKATTGPRKLNNMPLVELNRVENPAFEPDSGPPTPQMRPLQDVDNVYSDLGEPSPYAVDLCSGGKGSDPDLRKPYPSKRGREINKDWDNIHRQSIPLPPKPGEITTTNGREDGGYLLPCKGNPPPSYNDIHRSTVADKYGRNNLNINTDLIAPMTAVEERYGLDEDVYLKPTDHIKDNRNKAQAVSRQLYANAPDKPDNRPAEATYLPLLSSSPLEDEIQGVNPITFIKEEEPTETLAAENQKEGDKPGTEPNTESQREESPDYLRLKEPTPPKTADVEDGSTGEPNQPVILEPPKPIMRDIQQREPDEVSPVDCPPDQPAPPVPPPDSPPVTSAPPVPIEVSLSGAIANEKPDEDDMKSVCVPNKDGLPVNANNKRDLDLDKSIPVIEDGVAIYAIRKES